MAKTPRDAYRHIHKLSKLFCELKSLADETLDNFLKKFEKKKHFKQSLKRMMARGLITHKNGVYKPTKEGDLFFRRNIRNPDFIRDTKLWDSKWRLISFDVPISCNRERDLLRSLLKEFDFYPLHKSVWVCPNRMSGDFWKLLVDYELDKYCKAMLVEIIEGDEELKNYFFKRNTR